MPIPINPIFAWCFFAVAIIYCACLMYALLDIEIERPEKVPEPPPEFPEARVKDAPYNIIMAAAEHKRMEER